VPPSYANFSLRECRVNSSTDDGATPDSDATCEVCRAVAHRLPRTVVSVTTPVASAVAIAPINMTASGQIPVAL
jgi:hypothetical protein